MNRPSAALILTLDQGGHSSRALVYDRRGRTRAAKAIPVATRRPRSGWVEQDPEEIVDSLTGCLEAVARELGDAVVRIGAAGLAAQRSSVVCWNRSTGEALSPVLSWQDRRGEPLAQALGDHAPEIRATTGLVLSSNYGATKIRWCLDHLSLDPSDVEEGRIVVGPLASFLLSRLCHERPVVVDPAIAARTQLWDLEAADWSPRLLELFGIPASVLPEGVPNRYDFGHLSLGGVSVPLTVSTGDQSAALFADGPVQTDATFVTLGTGAFIQRGDTGSRPCPAGLLQSVVWHDGKTRIGALEGSVNGCGSALDRRGSKLGLDMTTIVAEAPGWLDRSSSPPLFLNGVSGLGSPYWVASYPTALVGAGEPWQEMVAVLESIVFLVQINLEAMDRTLGPVRTIRLAGGLAALNGLCQRLADLSGAEIERSRAPEATARGLAYLIDNRFGAGIPTPDADRFEPRSNPDLEARFWRWQRELEERLPDPWPASVGDSS